MTLYKRSRAVAFLLVIMVVALMTVIVFAFARSSSVSMLVASNNMDELKARTAIAGAVQYAAVLLKVDRMQSECDSLDEEWAQDQEFELGDVRITARIVDEASRFNMNRLLANRGEPAPAMVDLWENAAFAAGLPGDTIDRMLELLEKRAETPLEQLAEQDAEQPGDSGQPLVDDEILPGDDAVSTTTYAPLKVPIQPRDLELLLFGEVSSEDSPEKLFSRQFTTVSRGWVNLNTASEALLDYIFTGDEPTIVDSIITEREDAPFETEEDLARIPGLAGTGKARMFTVRSTVFAVNVEARIGHTIKRAVCILKRFKSGQCIPVYYRDDIPAL